MVCGGLGWEAQALGGFGPGGKGSDGEGSVVNCKGRRGRGRRAIERGIKLGNVLCILPSNKYNCIRIRQHDLTFVYQEEGRHDL